MSMPLKKRPFRGPRTLSAKVTKLSREVAKNRNERQYWTKSNTFTPAGTGLNVNTINVIAQQIADSSFPFTISGDKWNLHGLRLQGLSGRVVVYYPKKTGTVFTPTSFNELPDRNQFVVLMDSTQNDSRIYTNSTGTQITLRENSSTRQSANMTLNKVVQIARVGAGPGSSVERGDLTICYLDENNLIPPNNVFTLAEKSYQLTFSDK